MAETGRTIGAVGVAALLVSIAVSVVLIPGVRREARQVALATAAPSESVTPDQAIGS